MGHLTQLPVWMDPRLTTIKMVRAAAGTPHLVFGIAPQVPAAINGVMVAAGTS